MTSQIDTMATLGLEESISVDIPNCMDIDSDSHNGMWTLNLYADGCLDCSSLMANGTVDYSKKPCHFNNGNQHCPAVSLKIAFVGKRIIATRRIKAAQDKGDTQALLRQMAKLADLPEDDRKYVLAQIGIQMPESATEGLTADNACEPSLGELLQRAVPPQDEATEVDC